MTKACDLLIVGVGGQGTILASNVIGEACLVEGIPVKGAETHGMAQRGGSVETHLRIGGIFGPLISAGTADLLVSFDLLEALRYIHFLRPGGVLVSSSQIIVPTTVFMQGLPVPVREEIENTIRERVSPLCIIDADQIALSVGNILTSNVVMLGAATHFLPLSPASVRAAVAKLVPPKTVEVNLKAFDAGITAGMGSIP